MISTHEVIRYTMTESAYEALEVIYPRHRGSGGVQDSALRGEYDIREVNGVLEAITGGRL